MSGPQQSVGDAAYRIFALSFDLVGAEAGDLPRQIEKTLTSPAVQGAIRKTLLDFIKTAGAGDGSVFQGDEAMKLATALEKNVADPAKTEMLKQIKGTPEYKKLAASLDAFKKAAESSSLGVWADRNKGILYVVGAALVLGGGAVLYVTKTGGPALNTALGPLKGVSFEVLHVGALKVGVGSITFQPDARVLGAHVISTMSWEKVQISLNLGILAKGDKVEQASGEAMVKSGPVTVTASAATNTGKPVNLGLKVAYKAGKFNLGLGAIYKDGLGGGTASAGYDTGKYGQFGLKAGVGGKEGGGTQADAMATWQISF